MKLIKMKCPSCGGALKCDRDDMLMQCPYCGTTLYLDDEKQPAPVNIHIENYHAREAEPVQKRQAGKGFIAAMVAVLLPVLLMLGFILVPLLIEERGSHMIQQAAYRPRRVPQSAAMVQFVETAFKKTADQITDEEYGSIRYLKTYRQTKDVFADDVPWTFCYATEVDEHGLPIDPKTIVTQDCRMIEERDLQAFPNLVRIEMKAGWYNWAEDYSDAYNLKNLKQLKYLYTDSERDAQEIINGLSEPAMLEEFGIEGLRSQGTAEALAQLTNLRELQIGIVPDEMKDLSTLAELKQLQALRIEYLDNEVQYDIGFLSGMTNLKELALAGSELDIQNLSVLYGMPQLEALQLSGIKGLREVGFVQNMPKLQRLTLSDCPLTQITELQDKLSLTELSLTGMSTLQDVSVVSTLTGLKKLTLTGNWSLQEVPALGRLTSLTEAILTYKFLPVLEGTAVERLTIEEQGASNYSIAVLESLPALESLTIWSDDCDIEDENAGDIIASLPKLKELIGFGDSLYYRSHSDQSGLFASATMEKMVCGTSDAYHPPLLELDPEQMMDNTVLKSLDMNHLKINDARTEDFDTVPAGKMTSEILPHFKAIEELSIQNVELQDLSFVTQMPNLKRIDFSDNYVKDVSPLLSCSQLEEVICRDNPVSNANVLPQSVRVIQ